MEPGSPDQEPVATFKDACQMIDSLNIGITIPPSLQPPVELHHFSIAYWPVSDQQYENPASMMIALAELNKEIETQKKVVHFLEEAHEHAKNLYTWRSLMRLFVRGRTGLTDKSEESKAALTSCIQVMEPEVEKLFNLFYFHKEAAKFLASEIHKISQSIIDHTNKNFYSETCLVTMGKMMGAFIALDNLICFNAAFKNDFAEYRRTLVKAKGAGISVNSLDQDKVATEMVMFFAERTPLQDALFKELQGIDQKGGGSGFVVNFFKKLIVTCAEKFSQGKYIMPSEKEDYLKIISCCLKFIMRSEKKFESNNQVFSTCFSSKERDKIISCFKTISILKDFGDVPIDEKQLLVDMTGKGSDKQSSIHKRLPEFQAEHSLVVCSIMDLVRQYNLKTEKTIFDSNEDEFEQYLDSVAKDWYEVCVKALKCLESITGAILSFYVWKLCNGVAIPNENITSYSKVTKYNYNMEEKTDLTIAIGLAKGLQNVLLKYEEIFSFLIGRHCFTRLHHLTNYVIPEGMDKCKSKHKQTLQTFIDCLVKVSKKFKNPYKQPSQVGPGSGRKGSTRNAPTVHEPPPKASIGPGNSQMYMIKSTMEWICSSEQIKLKKRAADLNTALMEFHGEMFYWSYVLNLSTVIPKTGDLSIMWFRESYLTMEVAKPNPDPQFGLNESMPWILAEHLLESDTSTGALIEHCLIPFELYNDSAEAVLKFFRKQHLFDELEAETSLGFEQLVNWLFTHVFENAIERALYEYAVNKAPVALKSSKIGEPRKLNCSWLLRQSNIIMLGQTINLRERLVAKLGGFLREELCMIFSRFRSSNCGFSNIWEANTKVEIFKIVYNFLIEDVELPEFETLLFEAKSSAFTDKQGFHHALLRKLENVVFPMFNFDLHSGSASLNPAMWNSLTSYQGVDDEWHKADIPEYKTKFANKKSTFCMNASDYTEKLFMRVVAPIFSQFFYTVTDEHYRAMLSLLTLEEIAYIISECCRIVIENFAKEEVKGSFSSQATPSVLFTLMQLRDGMSSSACKLKPSVWQTPAQIVMMHESFSPIVLYKDFNFLTEGLTEVGNAMIFLYHLEKVMKAEDAKVYVTGAIFSNQYNCTKYINRIGRGRFVEIKTMSISKLLGRTTAEELKKIENHANEATNAYVQLKIQLLERSNIFNYLDPQQRTTQMLGTSLSVPEESYSLFAKLLTDLQEVLRTNNKFDFFNVNAKIPTPFPSTAQTIPSYDVIPFHWLWSAILFGMAKPQPNGAVHVKTQFSDGVSFAGSVLLSLLGQQDKFQCFDLCSFLRTVHEVEVQEGTPSNLNLFDLNKTGVKTDLTHYLQRSIEIANQMEANFRFTSSAMKAFGIPEFQPKDPLRVQAILGVI